MATDIGKVGIVMKGSYNSENTYEVLDAVNYNSALYIAKQNVPAGTLPTNTSYWQNVLNNSNCPEDKNYMTGAGADTINVNILKRKFYTIYGFFRSTTGTTLRNSDGMGVVYLDEGDDTVNWLVRDRMQGITAVSYSDGVLSISATSYYSILIRGQF